MKLGQLAIADTRKNGVTLQFASTWSDRTFGNTDLQYTHVGLALNMWMALHLCLVIQQPRPSLGLHLKTDFFDNILRIFENRPDKAVLTQWNLKCKTCKHLNDQELPAPLYIPYTFLTKCRQLIMSEYFIAINIPGAIGSLMLPLLPV